MSRPRLLKSLKPMALPIANYFLVVGSALAVLLLIASWVLPEPPPIFPDRPQIIERAAIRIRSERKWPEKVVLDTNQPTIPPPSIEVAPVQQLATHLPDETADQTSVDTPAELKSDARPIDTPHALARGKRSTTRALRSLARFRSRNTLARLEPGEKCCRFGWENASARSNVASRNRVTRYDSWTGWHFPDAN